jgi:hypothetical protein
MERAAIKIGVVQGTSSSAVQRLMHDLALRWQHHHRIVGVLEDSGRTENVWNAGQLLSLVDGAVFPIFQDLGPGSTACNVHPEGAMSAGEAVRRDIEAGCDLVLLSKFGKLEAELGGGLVAAFVAAIEADAPVLTSVSPRFEEAWQRFAGDMYITLPADIDVLETWWQNVRMGNIKP